MCYITPLNFCYNEYKLKENGSRIMATSTFRNKNNVRPRKTGAAKRRRCLIQRRRLVSLGMTEEQVDKLDVKELRTKLKEPKRLQRQLAKAAAKAAATEA